MKKTWQVLTKHLSNVLSFQTITPITLARFADIDYHNGSRMKDGDAYEIGVSFFDQNWHAVIDTESFRDGEKSKCMEQFGITCTQAYMAAHTMAQCSHRWRIQYIVCVAVSCEGSSTMRSIFWNVFVAPSHTSINQLFREYVKAKPELLEESHPPGDVTIQEGPYEFVEPFK